MAKSKHKNFRCHYEVNMNAGNTGFIIVRAKTKLNAEEITRKQLEKEGYFHIWITKVEEIIKDE